MVFIYKADPPDKGIVVIQRPYSPSQIVPGVAAERVRRTAE